jgi:hypothetical protein
MLCVINSLVQLIMIKSEVTLVQLIMKLIMKLIMIKSEVTLVQLIMIKSEVTGVHCVRWVG